MANHEGRPELSNARQKPARHFYRGLVIALAAVPLVFLAINRVRYELRSYALLTHLVDPQASGPLLRFESNAVSAEDVTIDTKDGPVPGRFYMPIGVAKPHGIVVLPGIHHLGIYDPRFVNFSHALAASGFAVLTPVLASLADYHVDAASLPTIGASPAWLERRLGTGPVTVIALSFSGGLALLAACDPEVAPHMRALVLFGGYENLERVSRFLATGQEEFPNGRVIPAPAHDYGASVFVYAHLPQFFDVQDISAAHEALKYWLWEEPENAQAWVDKLSPPARKFLDALISRRIDLVRPQLLAAIHADAAELASLSPDGKLRNLRVPIFILHGATDTVIPPAESRWLEKELPRRNVRAVLITPAFTHVDLQHKATWIDQLHLVDFIAAVLQEAS
jgi:pimeloyl-ACP methyl ester carboxylesterase